MYHTGDKRFASAVPYASIIVELDDAPGALLAGNLLEAPYTEAKVGRRVEVIFEQLNDDITLPQFRLARTDGEVDRGGDPPMWEQPVQDRGQRRGLFSRVTRSAEIPLAAHALEAVKDAVADSGLAHGGHRRPGDLSGTAGDRTRGGRRHHRSCRSTA